VGGGVNHNVHHDPSEKTTESPTASVQHCETKHIRLGFRATLLLAFGC